MLRFRRWPNDNGLAKHRSPGWARRSKDAAVTSRPERLRKPLSACRARQGVLTTRAILYMHPTRKGMQWHFGMKLHIGLDNRTGPARCAQVAAANVPEQHLLAALRHGRESWAHGDSASQNERIHSEAPIAKVLTNWGGQTRRGA